MIDQLLHLPYVTYWLPAVAAALVVVPLIWFALPSRAATASAPSANAPPPAPEATPAELAHAPEQRRSFRRGGNSIGLLYKYPGQKDGPAKASVLDRSIGGLCVLNHEQLPIGTVLSIRPSNADNIVPWVEVEVCVCRPGEEKKSFEIGCRFVKTPPYSIMLLFG